RLLPGMFQQRFELNRRYLMSLRSENLLQNHYMEAGLWAPRAKPVDCHWGWESPTCQVRGQFLGHWLSAAARIYASTGDPEVKGKADGIVSELARCQEENGGEWVGSIPEKYLDWVARGKSVWAPHYVLHKTLMGLYDMAAYAGNEQALDIMVKWARWFHRWTGQFSREQMDDILDVETGGMLEAWANLYGITGKQEHLDLIYRYDRPRLFERLLAGEDPLTNRHANTTVPEAHGAARAYEVTGEERWRRIVEAYWRCAVTERGFFCTGGQTTGEVWTPPFEFAARLGDKNQEHCVVYNMMRLADYLLRWTGDVTYADYIERNLYNGILAQQHPETGMVAYFLPLQAGAKKIWGTPTEDFWCCHGTLVQAHTLHNAYVYYQDAEGLAVCQYIPTTLEWEWGGVPVTVRQDFDTEASTSRPREPDGAVHRPQRWVVALAVRCVQPATFTLKLRLPWWLGGQAQVTVNGDPVPVSVGPSTFVEVRRTWQEDTVRVVLPKALSACPLPDEPDTVAFMDGPVVLAGLCDEERVLYGDKERPETILAPDNEREWWFWRPGYRARNQERGLRFAPLYEIRDERYTVYFPVRPE
ncbi:MAG: glycoside hydrolase family 127 protein, partial [Anaerolineae bacterium]|nr:glycoside hydrolase family 127 protein [Anaerolineae bacterium]